MHGHTYGSQPPDLTTGLFLPRVAQGILDFIVVEGHYPPRPRRQAALPGYMRTREGVSMIYNFFFMQFF